MCSSKLSDWYILPTEAFKESSSIFHMYGDSRPGVEGRLSKHDCLPDCSQKNGGK